MTRNFAKPTQVTELFRGDQVRSHTFQSDPGAPLPARSRVLPGDRVLVAIGLSKAGDACSQLVLMRRTALKQFYPWIAKDME